MNTLSGEELRKRGRDRAKKWRELLKEKGYKNINVMLSPEAQEVISNSKEHPKDSTADVLERILKAYKKQTSNVISNAKQTQKKQPKRVSSNVKQTTTKQTSSVKSTVVKTDREEAKRIIKEIQKSNHSLSPHLIAKEMNKRGLATLRGIGEWRDKAVKTLLAEMDE
ncbi:MAG: hypothetical protein GY710_15720 [Desulfobacteraceae bacterium]|nr:hypothetical protein [Desulfobacteraceae bacterium]